MIASYLLRKPTNNRTCQKKLQNLIKCIKDKIDQGLSKSIETLQDQLNESILLKRLEDTALHKTLCNQSEERLSAS